MSKKPDMEIKSIKLSDIIPYKKNAKVHNKKQIESVAASIERFGMVQPIVIDSNNEIIIGHCRFEGLKKLNREEAPCVIATDLSEDEIKALRLADNKLNESAWEMDLVMEEFKDLSLELQELTGFEFEELDPEVVEDEAPAIQEEVITVKGDLYEFITKETTHRVHCADSTSVDAVEKLMNGEKADMVFTDPPYNIDFKPQRGTHDVIKNDNMDKKDFIEFLSRRLIYAN